MISVFPEESSSLFWLFKNFPPGADPFHTNLIVSLYARNGKLLQASLTELLRYEAELKSSVESSVLFCIFSCRQMVPFSSVVEQMSRAAAVTETMWPTFWSADAPCCTWHRTDLSGVLRFETGLFWINPLLSWEESCVSELQRETILWQIQKLPKRKSSSLWKFHSHLEWINPISQAKLPHTSKKEDKVAQPVRDSCTGRGLCWLVLISSPWRLRVLRGASHHILSSRVGHTSLLLPFK